MVVTVRSYNRELDDAADVVFKGVGTASAGTGVRRTSAIVVFSKRSITRRWPSRHTRFMPQAPTRKQSGCSPTQTLSEIGPSTASLTPLKLTRPAGPASTSPPYGPPREPP